MDSPPVEDAAARGRADLLKAMAGADQRGWAAVRRQFPVLREWVYLDTATFGPAPRRGLAAAERHARRRDQRACQDFLSWFDDADRVRALAARLLNGRPEDICFAPNTGTALGWLVQGIRWRRGDQVVALQNEFPNNIYLGHMLEKRGVEFVQAPLGGGGFSLEAFCDVLNRRTRLVVMSTVNYATGFRPPVEEIGACLRKRGILYYVDATQSLGALRLDAEAVGADMVAAHGYKWLLAPAGIGVAYVNRRVREWLPPAVISWRSHRDWRQVDSLHHGSPELPAGALKYEGGLQNFPGIYALGAILEMMLALGLEPIERRVTALAAQGREVLRRAGGELLHDRLPHYDSPILAARFPGGDVGAMAQRLRQARVVVSARHGHLRVSPHFFNNEADLELLAEGLG